MKKLLLLVLPALFIFFSFNDVHALTENFASQEVYMAFCEINSTTCSGQGTNLPGIIYANKSYGFQDVGEYHFQGSIDLDPSYQYTVTINFNPYFDNFYENVWNNQIFTLKLYQSNNEVPVTYKSIHVTRPSSTYWVSIQVTFVPMLKSNHFSFRINTNRLTGDQLIMPPQEVGGILGDFASMNVEKVTYSATDQKLDNINQSILGSSAAIIGSLDDLKNQQQQTNQELNDINNTLNDDTPPSADLSSLGNVQGLLPPGPVDSLLNIPFEFLSVVNSSFGGVCKPLEFDFVFDSKLTLPCFSEQFYDEVPSYLLNFLSLIPAAFMLITYLKHLYKKVDRAMSLESNSDDEWGVL